MSRLQAAIYARVSSEHHAEAGTIESQVAALQERVAADGLGLPEELQFIDAGYSGATLVRPALERLRDLVAAGAVDRLYVHSPDRLARRYAYQVLLVHEFTSAGVEVIFLNRHLGQSPEDELLLQVQGIVAEYERAKLLERSRRGRRHAARSGSVSVLVSAPYGYRYIAKREPADPGRYEVVPEEARVVRQLFAWVAHERLTLGEVCRRLNRAGVPTRTGKRTWDRSVVWGMLKNPTYIGRAWFGRTRSGPWQPGLRPRRGRGGPPRRAVTPIATPADEWIAVPVPALIDVEVFGVVQDQLEENRQRARQAQRGARYLLQSLAVCARCGHAYYGTSTRWRTPRGELREYGYYRCIGTEGYRFGGDARCANGPIPVPLLDTAVWQQVRELLVHPQRLEQEYRRRLAPPSAAGRDERSLLEGQLRHVRQGLTRLIDGYAEGLIDKTEFEPRIRRLRERGARLEDQARQLAEEEAVQADLQVIIGRFVDFADRVQAGLADASWSTRRALLRLLVKRVEVDQEHINVVFRVTPDALALSFDQGISQDCGPPADVALRERRAGDASGLLRDRSDWFGVQRHGRFLLRSRREPPRYVRRLPRRKRHPTSPTESSGGANAAQRGLGRGVPKRAGGGSLLGRQSDHPVQADQ